MSMLPFQARITLNNATPTEDGHYRCEISLTDQEGMATSRGVTKGDRVFFDTSPFEPGTYTLYDILEVHSVNRYGDVDLTLQYLEINENPSGPPMLEFLIGQDGAIGRPSKHLGLVPVISPNTQGMRDNFSMYLLNHNLLKLLDVPRDDGGQTNVVLHTAQWLPVNPMNGRVNLPNVPLGDFVLNMGMAYMIDGSTVEISDLTPAYDDVLEVWYTQIPHIDLEELNFMVGAITLTYLIEQPEG